MLTFITRNSNKMQRLLLTILLALVSFGAYAGLSLTGAGGGGGTSGGGSSYTGPGDVVSGASFWFGLRAYNATYATGSNNAITIRRASDNATQNIVILSNGNLDTSTASTFCNATTCTVTTWYDQSGHSVNATQTTAAQQPALSFNCIASTLPCVGFTRASSQVLVNAACPTVSQPVTDSVVVSRTGSFTSEQGIIECHSGNNVVSLFKPTANQVYAFDGNTAGAATASDSTLHAMQFLFPGAFNTFVINVDGTDGSSGTANGQADGGNLGIGYGDSGSNFLQGNMGEAGRWAAGFSSGNRTSMCHNQRLYWSTPGSC